MKNNLPKLMPRAGKRLGRGYGSGKGGHTVGRGQKGQKARGSIGILFEGMKMKKSLIKRLPFRRGRLKMAAHAKPFIIGLEDILKVFRKGETITEKVLLEKGFVSNEILRTRGVKVLGSKDSDLKHDLVFEVNASKKLRPDSSAKEVKEKSTKKS